MFKPFKGNCINGCTDRWIVVKKGYCGPCNEKSKHRPERSNGSIALSGENDGAQTSSMDVSEWTPYKFPKGNPQKKKARKALQRRRKPSGELEVFKEMWEEELEKCDPQSPQCWCCSAWLGWELSVSFFSHLLAKGSFPSLRLTKRNIWIKCFKCHQEWEFGDRSQPKFRMAVKEAETLKQEYYAK